MKMCKLMKSWFLLILLLPLLIIGCGNIINPLDASSDFPGPLARGVSDITMGPGYQMLTGEVGGAEFIIYVPYVPFLELWNGDLVIYAHGYVNPQIDELSLPGEFADFSLPLMADGYAIACSSYSENGWAVKDGAIRTRQLLSVFTEYFETPGKTYLAGASEGAIISLMLAETNPELFDGVLAACGPAGGSILQTEYLFHIRALFQYFFEKEAAILPLLEGGSSILDVREGLDFETEIAPLIGLALSDPDAGIKLVLMSAVMTTLGFPILPEDLPETLMAALWYYYVGINDFFDRTHNHIMIDNQDTVYEISDWLFDNLDPYLQFYYSVNCWDINGWIERVTATPDAEKYLEHWYVPSGNLEIPVFMLHTTRDPVVPAVHLEVYKQLALSTGSEDNLYQWIIPGFGHCMLTDDPTYFNAAVITAFGELVYWVESITPTP
ncbi:MAG: alpha/beta hydrolase [Spirochaetales bacterium]|nr:alpha/beta hydrolase [Spirochaetales bacterium]